MKVTHHPSALVDEEHLNRRYKVNKRLKVETNRLQQLAEQLDPTQVFLVERRVIKTTKAEENARERRNAKAGLSEQIPVREFEDVTFRVEATNGADAANLADQAKRTKEASRGH